MWTSLRKSPEEENKSGKLAPSRNATSRPPGIHNAWMTGGGSNIVEQASIASESKMEISWLRKKALRFK